MKNNGIAVVCAGNRNFIFPMKIMLKSLLINTKSYIHVFVMISDWEKNDKKEFEELFLYDNVNISFIEVQNYKCLDEFKITRNITIESYFRLFIPEELPDNIEQVIYLDGDIIVEGDIKELWEIPINNNAIMAVPEMFHEAHYVSSPLALHTYKDLNIPESNKYFNAGVLKINLKKWREDKIAERIIEYLIKYKEKVLWHDQDGLNAVCGMTGRNCPMNGM